MISYRCVRISSQKGVLLLTHPVDSLILHFWVLEVNSLVIYVRSCCINFISMKKNYKLKLL